ncbi:Superoxide dismutase [Mn], mitochondrial [Podospora pseudocomata]|uniref:Superoxide dismutase n=1 Tax=Podospora pseudocomata TaxID=2093779 RepID=A0ABR0GRI2_9PEZI|nr:Superoxide dismutase [Mn], mitochondrial [Podospora pseudocomata]
MVNFDNILKYLAVQAPLRAFSGEDFNATKMAVQEYTLPALPYAYNALEPHISAQIMELHHSKHHQAYVTNLNNALRLHVAAVGAGDIASQIEMQQVIKFNGGGHINHSLFWKNLAPAESEETKPEAAKELVAAVEKTWGSLDDFKKAFSSTLLGIQGSGWGWLVKDSANGLRIVTTKDQDPVVGQDVPVFGVDMWEHAYYLQYLNGKAAYVENIWNVINWKTAEERFLGTSEATKL